MEKGLEDSKRTVLDEEGKMNAERAQHLCSDLETNNLFLKSLEKSMGWKRGCYL